MKRFRLVRLSKFFQSRRRPPEEHQHEEKEHRYAEEEHEYAEEEHEYAEEEWKYAEQEHRRVEEERRRSAFLEAEVAALTAALEAKNAADPATGGTGGKAPAKSLAAWGLLGLLLLGGLVTCAGGPKGGMQTVNIPFLLAAIVAIGAVTLHVYTMEVWIWPKLKDEGFPATPFGDPSVTKGFYRTVWHFFTVAWVGTIVLMLFFAFGDVIPYVNDIVRLLIIYWIGIVVSIFIVAALSLQPGESYVKTMIKAFQWVIVLIMVGFMYWGTKV